ncbi:beta-N-acetylhexosaminidase [Massilia sp. W12]|uniref:beta-N-acetylhexosaminidase n=1 Tax=Massilia sp. W12 TaxID=3126507 RepID=UPI0030D2596F
MNLHEGIQEMRITPRQAAGRLIMIRMPGQELSAQQAAFLRDNHIRAVCLFRQNMANPQQLCRLTADLRAAMGPDALIAIDQEGGAVVRATWLPAPPAAMGLGAADDETLAEQVGAAVARGVKALGFNWNFAPVLDLNNNLHNPVIAERSFGADPARVSALAAAWMRGSLAEGVACCVKHAPGHGDTHVDSHRDLPTVDKPLAALQQLEFQPFAALASDAPAMMTAHIVYPALDAQHPATLSPAILQGLIRSSWNFDGVIITDGMDMHAIAGRYGAGQAAAQALLAGADMVMALGNTETQLETLDALEHAIASGAISMEEIQQRLGRLDRLAARYPVTQQPDGAYAREAADHALMEEAWLRGLTALPHQGRLPQALPAGSALQLLVRADVAHDGVSEKGLSALELKRYLSPYYQVELSTFEDAESFDWAAWRASHPGFVLLASTSRLRYPPCVREHWRPDLHVCLWNPFQALDVAAPALLTYGFAAPGIRSALRWLRGEVGASGRNPCIDQVA